MSTKLTFENKLNTHNPKFEPLDLVYAVIKNEYQILIVQCVRQENETIDTFSGVVLSSDRHSINLRGDLRNTWQKSIFKNYIGTIIMESNL